MQSLNFTHAAKVPLVWASLVILTSVQIFNVSGARAEKNETKGAEKNVEKSEAKNASKKAIQAASKNTIQAASKSSIQAASKSSIQTEKAFVLVGKSDQYGAVRFKICSQAINIVDNLGMALWLASDPDTSFTLNAENHTIFPHKLNFGRLGEVDLAEARRLEIVKVELVDKPVLLGQKCNRYRACTQAGSKVVPTVEFWCLEKLPVPAKVNNAWCSLFLLPPRYGFPIQVEPCARRFWAHSFKLARLEREPVEKLTVKLPANYKTVTDKASLLFGDGSPLKKSDLDDLFRSD